MLKLNKKENKMEKNRVSQANIIAKECIVSALLKLIYEKPLTTITISELTKKAGVSRMTFYRNYDSKEEVFIGHLDEIFEHYWNNDNADKENGIYYDVEHMKSCFEYIYQHKEFLEGLIQCGMGLLFLDKLTYYISEKWKKYADKYELTAFTGSLYNLFILWISTGYKEDVDKMAKKIEKIYS